MVGSLAAVLAACGDGGSATLPDAGGEASDDGGTVLVDAAIDQGEDATVDGALDEGVDEGVDAANVDASTCEPGYRGSLESGCVDIDECLEEIDTCDPRTACTNTVGSYACGACPAGYLGTGKTGCFDIDECTYNVCDPRTTCTNTDGSFSCSACPAGSAGSGETGCDIINGCDENPCDPLTVCNMTGIGTFECSACPPGYLGSGRFGCAEIDECMYNVCDVLTTCSNTQGDFTCSECPVGYAGDGKTGCDLIDMCADDPCDPLTVCNPSAPGVFECSACPDGYSGTGVTGCLEINECADGTHNCPQNERCMNTPGSFTCSCANGFVRNTVTGVCEAACPSAGYVWNAVTMACEDLDECAAGTDGCDQLCNNTDGSFECACHEGFALGTDGICRCASGYEADGDTCVDINECMGDVECSANERCTNLPGSYTCGPCTAGTNYAFDGSSSCKRGQLESGGHFSCTMTSEGRVACWGSNGSLYSSAVTGDPVGLGMLGTGDTIDRRAPHYVEGIGGDATAARQIALGAETAYALLEDGTVVAWGADSTTSIVGTTNAGQLGNDSSIARATTPVLVSGLANVIEIAAGRSHACAIVDADDDGIGTIKCWGDNTYGQIGNNEKRLWTNTQVTTPANVMGIADAVSVTAGAYHTCALRATNAVVCWGRNDRGQLGDGTTTTRLRAGVNTTELDLNAVRGLGDVAAVVAGGYHTCAIDTDRRVLCWGDNSRGQLGLGDTTNRSTATLVPGLSAVVSLSSGKVASEWDELCADGDDSCKAHSGSATTCALYRLSGASTAIKCWGANTFGQGGTGSTTSANITTPTAVVGLGESMTMLGVGGSHVCAMTATGKRTYCWGSNQGGALGDGASSFVDENTYRPELDRSSAYRLRSLAATPSLRVAHADANDHHACVVLRSGEVRCWGSNEYGQLGVGREFDFTTQVPMTVASLDGTTTPFTARVTVDVALDTWDPQRQNIATGLSHTCAILTGANDGRVACWGRNDLGQLGFDSDGEPVYVPTIVTGVSNVTGVSAGDHHTCARQSDNKVYCWGSNSYGQIGVNTLVASYNTPQLAGSTGSGSQTALAVEAGGEHSCFRTSTALYCHGRGASGQLGFNNTINVYTPTQVTSGVGSNMGNLLSVGGSHTCAYASGYFYCWGDNTFRQIGSAVAAQLLIPSGSFISIFPNHLYLRQPRVLEAGRRHTCATIDVEATADSNPETFCWGANERGQVGNGGTSTTPAALVVTSRVVDVDGNALYGVVDVLAGNTTTFAIMSDGTLRAWGDNQTGGLGLGHTVPVLGADTAWTGWE